MLRREDVSPILRRFFINTLFDSTFMLLGIIVGMAYITNVHLGVVIVTMSTSSLALGISTGVSVYETESLERERKMAELERALFRELKGTRIEQSAKSITFIVAFINFLTPLISCAVVILPLLLAFMDILDVRIAASFSVLLGLGTLFAAGVYMGKVVKKNPWKKGLRMLGFGIIAFIIGYLLNSLVV
jgi:predicted membrane protein (TIGR00267 family)